jgi:hypothetical protein
MRVGELINALGEVSKRDAGRVLNLCDHPWVKAAMEIVPSKIMSMN